MKRSTTRDRGSKDRRGRATPASGAVPPVVRQRADQLVTGGMDPTEARQQATAEYAKGVLGDGCCVLVGRKRRTRAKGAE